MKEFLDIIYKLSPLAYLTLFWSVGQYFLNRRHQKKEKRNDENRIILLAILDICRDLVALVNEIMFLTNKTTHKIQTELDIINEGPDSFLALDSSIQEKGAEYVISELKRKYSQEEFDIFKQKVFDSKEKLNTLATEFTNLKQSSNDFLIRLEEILNRLNKVNIIAIDNPEQIKVKIDFLSELVQEYILRTIKEKTILNYKIVELNVHGNSLAQNASDRIKQL